MSQRQGARKATSRQRKAATRKTAAPKAKTKAKAKAKATAKTKASPQASRSRPSRPRVSAPRGTPAPDRSVIEQLSPRLREDFARLQEQEARILGALADPEIHRHFLEDPAGALDRMGVEVPPILRRRLRAQPRPDLVSPRRFRLPNGQVVTPEITVRFTSGKGDSR
jgi:hypothetical protein